MIAHSIREAWNIANRLFADSDYDYDAAASARAGYPVYWSTKAGSLAHINDLNARLEIVQPDYTCINVYIVEPEADPEAAEAAEAPEADPEAAEAAEAPEAAEAWQRAYSDETARKLLHRPENIRVFVTASDTKESRLYTIPELLKQTRFFWSGGRPYVDFENRLISAAAAAVITIDDLGFSQHITFTFSGLKFLVVNDAEADSITRFGKGA